jgi:rare lipoprotein A
MLIGNLRVMSYRGAILAFVMCWLAACAAPVRPVAPATPAPEQANFVETGLASWYGSELQGQQMANGADFDMRSMTAAHRSLAFGTIVRVTNLENGRTIKVRIADRGPFVDGRIIDLSANAGKVLGITGQGVAKVRIEVFASDQLPT